MAKLDASERNDLPKKEFGLPGSRKYPMPDASHAANAKARAAQQVKAGNLSPSSAEKIDAKANKIIQRKAGGVIPGHKSMGCASGDDAW